MLEKKFPRLVAALALALGFGGLSPSLRAQSQEIIPVRSGPETQSLNGNWQFKYIAGSAIGADATFHEPAFSGATAWKSIPVPSHWELHGFATPKYARPEEGLGLYRRTFRVPTGWSGQRIFLRFEGVLHGFETWVNGRRVGAWDSGYNPATFDITDALKADSENVLAVRVTTRSHGWEFDTNDCWGLSGIYREVTLFAAPAAHLKDFTTRTTLGADGTAQFSVEALAAAPANITARLVSPSGKLVREFPILLDASHRGSATIAVTNPELWTAESPSLYRLEFALSSGGKVVQRHAENIGLRQVSIADGVLRLNGKPIKLRGINHHDIWPVAGRVVTEELMRKDLEMIRAANINFVRTAHYPPHARLIELCDELGLYVMDEVPFGFGDDNLRNPAYQESLFMRARATVLRDKNRPSVIIWSVGNENQNTPLTLATGQRVKELDPSRPMCFPQVGSYFGRSYEELAEWVDIYAPHYPVVSTVKRYAETLKRPVIFTEYAHALGLATDRIQDEWAVMQAAKHIAGGAVWMFQDQGILRKADKPTDLATPSLYAWKDPLHYYDTSGNGGMDGIVYSDRTPHSDYWQVRKVYSPVQIAERSLTARVGEQSFTLKVENRFDFRALNGFKLAWTLQKNGAPVRKGTIPLKAAARTTEDVAISIRIPDDLPKNYYTLELRCLDERDQSFYERSLRLEPETKLAPDHDLFLSLKASPVEFNESPTEIRVTHARFNLALNRATGAIVVRDPTGKTLVNGIGPHTGRRFTEAEALRPKTTPIWTGALLTAPIDVVTDVARTEAGVRVRVRGKYPRPEVATQFIEGEYTLLVTANGSIDLTYDFAPVAATGTFLEAGLAIAIPAVASDFRWIGQGPHAGYPGKDQLNEFGRYRLDRDDIRFQGNRREVALAMLTNTTGTGVLIATGSADVAVERSTDGTTLSHNAVLSGLGNKGVNPESPVRSEDIKRLTGQFTLLPLTDSWPSTLTRWVGKPGEALAVERPFYRSYDQ